ncbi:MAG: DUF4097 family beta strand repeat-containing protein [Polyangia bacterium]|nr:DUF4097 family beta strand repeat-containing protein [Polyangia bacterium]
MRDFESRSARPALMSPGWALPFGLGALLLGASCALSGVEETEELSAPLGPGQTVKVETRNGRVEVKAGTPGRVKVKAIKKARATSKPEELLKEIKVKVVPGPDRVRISSEHPSGSLSRQFGVSFILEVPPGTKIAVETRNGGIKVSGVGGNVRAETRNGKVSVEDAKGTNRLVTRNGAIHLSGSPTAFELDSKNGAIRVSLGPQTALVGASSAVTRNGAIDLSAAPSFKAILNASTKNGRVKSDFPTGGEARPGEPSVRLQTKNGAIRIEKR